ncbi:hypothetical protein H0H92_005146 [Tricholoma furcatifolium]|nr:hypothetical protein H0H92_005146 [Tricholoma furcatifolium]
MPKVTLQGCSTANSKRLHTRSVKSTPTSRLSESKTLKAKDIEDNIAKANAERRLKPVKLWQFDIPDPAGEAHVRYEGSPEEHNLDDVLSGTASIDISHAGGEFEHLLDEISNNQQHSRKDMRTRRDRMENRTRAFELQMEGIVNSYISWTARTGDSALCEKPAPAESCAPAGGASIPVQVMDTYGACSIA